jgi:predicted TPR repeat methyltransferase
MTNNTAQNKPSASNEPDFLIDLLSKAVQAYQQGMLEDAQTIFQQIISIESNHPDALLALANIAVQLHDDEHAQQYLERGVAAHPELVEFHSHLANILMRQNKVEQAQQLYQHALKLKPDYAEAHHNLGILYYKTQRRDEALQSFAKAVQINPEYIDAHHSLGLLFLSRQQFDAAFTEFNNVVKLYPGHLSAQYQLANLYLQRQELDQALAHYQEVLKYQPEHLEALNNIGAILYQQGRDEDALQYFFRVITIEPKHMQAHHNMAAILMKLYRFTEALEQYQQLVDLQPEDVESHYNLGVALYELNQFEAAIKENLWVIAHAPNYTAAYINLGAAYMKKADLPQALFYYQKVLALQPDNVSVKYLIAALTGGQQPNQAPEIYIKQLFDQYAVHYDQHITQTLKYNVPAQIRGVLQNLPNVSLHNLSILDLGCGTGLSGAEFRDAAKRLIGVDLSTKMLNFAREKKIYDELIEGDIIIALNKLVDKYDLIISSDTLVYLGNLQSLFSACRKVLNKNGNIAFSTELLVDDNHNYVLQKTGRYAHNPKYIYDLAEQLGYLVVIQQQVVLRVQDDQPCQGVITVLKIKS